MPVGKPRVLRGSRDAAGSWESGPGSMGRRLGASRGFCRCPAKATSREGGGDDRPDYLRTQDWGKK